MMLALGQRFDKACEVKLSMWCGVRQLCRASGHHEAAGTAALEALARGVPGAGLERARLLWARDQQHGAVVRLQEARTPLDLSLVLGYDPETLKPLHLVWGKHSKRRCHV